MLIRMRIVTLIILVFLLLDSSNIVYAQDDKRKVEIITIPYTSANTETASPEYYSFPSKHEANWILNIHNNLIYNKDNSEAKVVLRLKENPDDTDFIEIVMFGPPSYRLWLGIANEEIGYMRIYENTNAWFVDKSVALSFVQNERLSVNNGQRIVLDRLRIGEFTLSTIEVYGMDKTSTDFSVHGGDIKLDIMSGNPLDNPVLMIPPILGVVTAVTIITLLMMKKRT